MVRKHKKRESSTNNTKVEEQRSRGAAPHLLDGRAAEAQHQRRRPPLDERHRLVVALQHHALAVHGGEDGPDLDAGAWEGMVG